MPAPMMPAPRTQIFLISMSCLLLLQVDVNIISVKLSEKRQQELCLTWKIN
jgi:hypothetical protein